MVSGRTDCSKIDRTNKSILYTAFHLNLAFSSVEKAERKTIIERCYWPLLKLAEEGIPIGLEATSFTLLEIQRIAPDWLGALKTQIEAGCVELIGSGYCQIIGPLVPPEVTEMNLQFGLEDYEKLLGCRPKIALINEQAYACGLLPLYMKAGFEAVMMDWAEPASHNRDWEKAFSQRPQLITGADGSQMPVIWSDAISFQKFQRYAHGELSADEYLGFLSEQISAGAVAVPLYTSDAEVFDYRPGRFTAEAQMQGMSEFERIRLLLKSFKNSDDVVLALPSEALSRVHDAPSPLKLETTQVPVPVKKQRKYNITRWGLTGRADVRLNTYCWRLFERLSGNAVDAKEVDWRHLCQLWASDYRTHITESRWLELGASDLPSLTAEARLSEVGQGTLPSHVKMQRAGRFLSFEAGDMHLVLNEYRGLAIQSFGYGEAGMALSGKLGERSVIGTLAHGYFDDIAYGADFYSGHFVQEPVLSHKVTDLVRCEPEIEWLPASSRLKVSAIIGAGDEALRKTLLIDFEAQSIEIEYEGSNFLARPASKRLGYVTLNPDFFDRKTLFYATHNGGRQLEQFPLYEANGLSIVDHGAAVSSLVSASTALGMTNGQLFVGDGCHYVAVEMKRSDCAGLGMIKCSPVRNSYFLRAYISVGELDETSRFEGPEIPVLENPITIRVRLSLGETAKLL